MPRDREANRGEWLIDEAGNLWRAGAPGLRKKMRSDLPWEYLRRYAVEGLGYCAVSTLPNWVQIGFRAQNIGQPALAAAIHWLPGQKTARGLGSLFGGSRGAE